MSGVGQIQNHIFRPTSSFLPCKIFFLPSIFFLLNRNHHHPFLVPQHLHSHHHLPPLISPSFDSHHHSCRSRLSPPPSLGLSWSDSSTISRLHLLSIINFSLALLGRQSVVAFHLLWSRSTIAAYVSLRSSAKSASPLIDQHHHHLAFPC